MGARSAWGVPFHKPGCLVPHPKVSRFPFMVYQQCFASLVVVVMEQGEKSESLSVFVFSSLSFLYLSLYRLWKCSSWNFRSVRLAAASAAVIPSCQCVLVPSYRMVHVARPLLLFLAFFLHADAESKPFSHSLGGYNEWFCLQLAPRSGPLNMFPLEVNPETLWDPPWLPASLSKRLLTWLAYHFLSVLMPFFLCI